MSVPALKTCRKRKRTQRVYDLQRFGEDGFPVNRNGAFRENIRVFLGETAEVKDYSIREMPVWCTLLRHDTKSIVVPLYTIEEDVARSSEPYCDHCRCTGWSNHLVSKSKYHFIIPIEWDMPLEESAFDHLHSHLLHGLIHTNGFGHLICVNGIEGGSKYLSGREIVGLWDRICTKLGARMITVEDLSKKKFMDLRLLYGIGYGHSWFGKWGYKFCRGSYGVTKTLDYENALHIIGSLKLDQIESDFIEHEQYKEIKQIFRYYRELSEGLLNTFRDLLRFMLFIKSHAPQTNKLSVYPRHKQSKGLPWKNSDVTEHEKPLPYTFVAANLGSKWPVKRLQLVAEIIVRSLKDKKALGQNAVNRQDVRDAARLHIGDTGLLDYVLKTINNSVVGNTLVRRFVDPLSRSMHYTILELDDATQLNKEAVIPLTVFTESKAGADVHKDLELLYANVLLDYPESESVRSAIQAVLDSKHFVKEWPLWDKNDQRFQFVCHLGPSFQSDQVTELPSGELVTVSLQASVFDLKQAIEESFKDTYCVLTNFVVNEIDELEEEDMEDDDDRKKLLFGRIESCSALTVRGSGMDVESKLKFQGGCDSRMVKCVCEARDDDGERMVACDVCDVWQHTRCCGIADSHTLPPLFVCSDCCEEFAEQQRKPEFPNADHMLLVGASDDYFGDETCLGIMFPSETFLL